MSAILADTDLLARFWKKTTKGKPGVGSCDCWEWTACTEEKGYGKFRLTPSITYAVHRLAYMLEHGEYPDPDLMILHSCDNRACVNPAHLSLGTATQNNREIVERGRHGNQHRQGVLFVEKPYNEKGADSWTRGTETILRGGSVLTKHDVQEIRTIAPELPDNDTLNYLATTYRVSPESIRNVILGRTFAWVPAIGMDMAAATTAINATTPRVEHAPNTDF